MIDGLTQLQEDVCRKYDAAFAKPELDGIVGVAENINTGLRPLNGLRHSRAGDTTGWYLWAGDYSPKADFFKPMHMRHVIEAYPALAPYLGLPPGWRFLIDPEQNYEDVWRDDNLILLDE